MDGSSCSGLLGVRLLCTVSTCVTDKICFYLFQNTTKVIYSEASTFVLPTKLQSNHCRKNPIFLLLKKT